MITHMRSPPQLILSADTLTGYVGEPVDTVTIRVANGVEARGFTMFPHIPDGLQQDPRNGSIFGTPVITEFGKFAVNGENEYGVSEGAELFVVVGPSRPTGFSIQSDTASMTLNWNKTPEAIRYSIHREDSTTEGEWVRSTFDTVFLDYAVDKSRNYRYWVTALGRDDQKSQASDTIEAQLASVSSLHFATIENLSPNEDGSFEITIVAHSSNSHAIALTVVQSPQGASFTDSGNGVGILEWNPAKGLQGDFPVHVQAVAGQDTTSLRFNLAVGYEKQSPEITVYGHTTVRVKERLKVTGQVAMSGGSGAFLAIENKPDGAVFSDSGNGAFILTWTPGQTDIGTHEDIRIIATDKTDASLRDTAEIVITVTPAANAAPMTRDTAILLDEDSQITFPLPISDQDGDSLTVSIIASTWRSAEISLPDEPLLGSEIFVTYKPKLNVFGPDTFQYFVVDGEDTSETSTVTVLIKAVNDRPFVILKTPETNLSNVSSEDAVLRFESQDVENSELVHVVYLSDDSSRIFSQPTGLIQTAKTNVPLNDFHNLEKATCYFWAVTAMENESDGLADTSEIRWFYTSNSAPVWTKIEIPRFASRYSHSIDLSKHCTDPEGHPVTFHLLQGKGCILEGNVLRYVANDTEVSLRAIDHYALQPCSSTTAFQCSRFSSPQMKLVENGVFEMGSASEWAYPEERPVHSVTISRSFHMDSTEVTQRDYYDLMSSSAYGYSSFTTPPWGAKYGLSSAHPAYFINWNDALLYCNARSKRDGFDTVYTFERIVGTPGNDCDSLISLQINYDRIGYRLPTEAEWELACRAGATEDWYWSGVFYADTSDYMWYADNSDDKTHPVGLKNPNALGLYDMLGNVAEWCNDRHDFDYYTYSPAVDPKGPEEGMDHLVRGGAYNFGTKSNRAAMRGDFNFSTRLPYIGFRVILPDPASK